MRAEAKHVEARGPRSFIRRAAALALVLVCTGCEPYDPNEVFDYRCKSRGITYDETVYLQAVVGMYIQNNIDTTEWHYSDFFKKFNGYTKISLSEKLKDVNFRHEVAEFFLSTYPNCCQVGRSPVNDYGYDIKKHYYIRQQRRDGKLAAFVTIKSSYISDVTNGTIKRLPRDNNYEVGNCLEIRSSLWNRADWEIWPYR